MNNQGKWDLDRKPTKRERIAGSIFSFLILLFASLILFVNVSMFLESEASFTSTIIVSLMFLGSLVLFARISFGKRKKPSPKAIRFAGHILFGLSCSMFLLPFFSTDNPAHIFYALGAGCTGIAGSKLIINQGAKHENT